MTLLIYDVAEQSTTTATTLHPYVCQNVMKAQMDQHAVLFEVSPAGDAYRDRLNLNRTSAECVASFLERTPRIKGLSIVSNIHPKDGAMEVMTNAFRTTQHIAIVCLWGDGDDYDEDVQSYYDNPSGHSPPPPNMDDGTTLECLSLGLPSNTSVRNLRFHFYNFSSKHINRIHLHRLLLQKRDFQKFTFSACDFGAPGSASFLLEGLAVQTELQELSIDMDDYEAKLDDNDLANLIYILQTKGPRKSLRVLNLYDCGLGPKSLKALIAYLAQPDCPLVDLRLGGTRRLFRFNLKLRRAFLETLCFANCSLSRIEARHQKNELVFQRILQLCVQRNQLLSLVGNTLQHQHQLQQKSPYPSSLHLPFSSDLALWGRALESLAQYDRFIGGTSIFAVLTALAPQIAQHAVASPSPLPVKRDHCP